MENIQIPDLKNLLRYAICERDKMLIIVRRIENLLLSTKKIIKCKRKKQILTLADNMTRSDSNFNSNNNNSNSDNNISENFFFEKIKKKSIFKNLSNIEENDQINNALQPETPSNLKISKFSTEKLHQMIENNRKIEEKLTSTNNKQSFNSLKSKLIPILSSN